MNDTSSSSHLSLALLEACTQLEAEHLEELHGGVEGEPKVEADGAAQVGQQRAPLSDQGLLTFMEFEKKNFVLKYFLLRNMINCKETRFCLEHYLINLGLSSSAKTTFD